MARSNFIQSILKPILDFMQTMPSFVYLVPVMMLFGLGKVPAVFATIIYAAPPVIRLTNTGIRQVPQNVVEAARAFGSSTRQTLFEVQLPLAIPSIMVGINQTTMMALAMVVIASMVGAGGLGLEVLRALQGLDMGRGFQAGLSIVLLAIIIDRITGAMAARQQRALKTTG
jgi:glycine betaine/proline transport system permease protein